MIYGSDEHRKAWEATMFELVDAGIMEIMEQDSNLRPGFRFTRKHMERVISRDEEYIRYLKREHDINTTEEHIANFKKHLENYEDQKKLN